jgi:superoxide dismutase
MTIRSTLDLLAEGSESKLSRVTLPYTRTALSPSISSAAFDFHYGKLYKKYVDGYNDGDNKTFNEAGAYLHGLYFSQFNRPHGIKPYGHILDIINRNYSNFIDFKKSIKEVALKQTGSYWVYLSKSGQIKVIQNHAKRTDIAILLDMWEHSWVPDFHDKGKYIDSIWKIMDWAAINKRL